MKPGRVSIAPCGHSRPSKSERIPQEKNVKFAKPLVLALTLIVATPVLSLAHDYRVGSLAIDQPWARAMPAGAPVAGGYLTITNTGSEPDRLLGGTSDAAEAVEIHESTLTDGVDRNRPVAEGHVLAPGHTPTPPPGTGTPRRKRAEAGEGQR